MNRRGIIVGKITVSFLYALLLMGAWTGYTHAATPSHQTTWTIRKGMTLNEIARKTYGHQAYVRMIAIYNGLEPQQTLYEGMMIQTPELPNLFKDVGLIPTYEKQLNRIFYVIEEYRKLIPEYAELAKKGHEDRQPIDVPQPIMIRLNLFASMLEKTVKEMEDMTQETGDTPNMMLRQATNSADKMRRLAEGWMTDTYKDLDMITQHLAHILVNAVAWSKE